MRAAVLALTATLTISGFAQAQTMHVMESRPAAQGVMDGAATQFFVRFDGPVDHSASLLQVERGGTVVQSRRPRLGSQPSVLYASFGNLARGPYLLRWRTRGLHGNEPSTGMIPFSVAGASPP